MSADPFLNTLIERAEKRRKTIQKSVQSPGSKGYRKDDLLDPSLLSVSARRALFEKNPVINPTVEDDSTQVTPEKVEPFELLSKKIEISPSPPAQVSPVSDEITSGAFPAIVSPLKVTSGQVSPTKESILEEIPQENQVNFTPVKDCPVESISDDSTPFVINAVEKTHECYSPADVSLEISSPVAFSPEEVVPLVLNAIEKSPEKVTPHNVTPTKVTDSEERQYGVYPRLPSLGDLSPLKISPLKNLSTLVSPVKSGTPMRTLSQYRRDQKRRFSSQANESNENEVKSNLENEAHQRDLLKEHLRAREAKIDFLQAEADKYNKMIYQSYQALDLCIRNNNVPERLEAEKILLVSSERKKACCSELLRLQDMNEIDLTEDPVGQITINRLKLLVRGDFIVKQTYGHDLQEYFFICLFKCGEVVIESEVLSSSAIQAACLTFTKPITFMDLRKDFMIHLDIYALKILKSRKNSKKLDSLMTPKKKSDLNSPSSASKSRELDFPGMSFHLVGSADLIYSNLRNELVPFENFKYNHILEDQAIINASMCCRYNIKYASYLNFHQMSGDYPVWNRRWCVLNGPLMYYWRYEEDEEAKEPMGLIELRKCVNNVIEKATSDICMRPNSFAFVTIDEQKIPMKHLMAADLREERDDWLSYLNKVLLLARTWDDNSRKPVDEATLDSLMR